MANIDDFKLFVKKNPTLITFIRNDTMTWQKFYELYDLYGEDEAVWTPYLKKEEKNISEEKTKTRNSFSNIIEMAKRMDANKLQEGITSIQKAIGLFGDMLVKDGGENTSNSYSPRPVYRRFDD